MAYDAYFADRVAQILENKKANFLSKKMMGGMLFMVDNKMLCGVHIDKKTGDSFLMCRIGEKRYEKEIKKDVCCPMDFTGRPMKGYVFVMPDGFDLDEDLEYWIQLCLDYNPQAEASKPKKKTKNR